MSKQQFQNYYNRSFTIAQQRTDDLRQSIAGRNFRFPTTVKKNHIVAIAAAILILAGLLTIKNFLTGPSKDTDTRTTAPVALATQELNKSFQFPLKDDKGKEVAKITYLVESASIQDSFIYQGKVATAVKGRTFLIFSLKVTNPYTNTIEVNSKDYIRVKVNGSDEQLAPEIHNDPVEIQAKSTKYTRIGLPINDTDKNIVLLIGELQGKKETVTLDLKR